MKKRVFSILFALVLVLSFSLVTAAPVAASTGPELVGLWHFDEGSGVGTVADSSGNDNTGTVVGATTGVAGMFGNALSFDGVNDYVQVPDANSLDLTTAITLEAWIKAPTGQANGDPIVWKEGAYLIQYWNNSVNAGVFTAGGWGGSGWLSTASIFDNTWHHVALTYDGSHMRLYIDGGLNTTKAWSGNIITNANDLYFACRTPTTYLFTGKIDEVRIWSSALTPAQLNDMTPPSASITIDGGADYTNLMSVTLSLTASDTGSGVKDVRYSNDGSSWPAWESFAAPKSWTLSPGDGTKTVYYQVRDNALNTTQATDTIILDQTLPVVTITAPVGGAYYQTTAVPVGAYTVVDANSYTVEGLGWSDAEGVHTYTVTATDVAGNVGSDSVTYYVLENFVTGGGKINTADGKKAAWTFAGTVGNLEDGSVGQFQIVDHVSKIAYHCHNSFSSLVFSGGDATFIGIFTSNKGSPVTLAITIKDLGEPGAGVDEITIAGTELTGAPSGALISGGNFQVHDIE